MTIPTHIAVHGTDLGMSFAQSAYLLTAIGGASIAGRLAVGVFLDLYGQPECIFYVSFLYSSV